MQFYIRSNDQQEGPYDLITLIRKIRNGSLSGDALVMEENEESAIAARMHPELNSFFREMDEDYVSDETLDMLDKINLSWAVDYGLGFLRQNMIATLSGAFFLLGVLLSFMLFSFLTGGTALIAIPLTLAASAVFFCGLVFMLQQLQRFLPFSIAATLYYIRKNSKNLLLFGGIICLPLTLGFSLFLIPGLWMLAHLAFAPFLIVETHMPALEAIQTSHRAVMENRRKLYPVLFGLLLLNIAALICFALPLIFTLPITVTALQEIYDKLAIGE